MRLTDESLEEVLSRTLGVLSERFTSPNESDSNGEPANIVDGLFAIARAIDRFAIARAIGASVEVSGGEAAEIYRTTLDAAMHRTWGPSGRPENG